MSEERREPVLTFALLAYLAILAIEYLGLAYQIPALKAFKVSLVLAVCLFAYSVFRYGVSDWLQAKQVKLLLFFTFLTLLSVFHAFVRTYSVDVLKAQVGFFMLLVVGYHALRDPRRLELALVFLVVLHSYLVIVNGDKLFAAVRAGGYQAGYFLGDGNDFGWGLNVMLAFAVYGVLRARRILTRLAAGVFVLLLGIGILGTQSRGATVAMVAGLLYLWLVVAKRKMLGLLILASLVIGVLALAPSEYFARMETLRNYEEDTSAIGRLTAWKAATQMALDNPVLGVGAGNFNSVYGRFYRRDDAWSARWISPHSIYFLVLGEYGFTGLFTILGIFYLIYRENQRSRERMLAIGRPLSLPQYWPEIINMSLVTYAIAGLFLGGINYPHVYMLVTLTLATKHIVEQDIQKVSTAAVSQGAHAASSTLDATDM